jgi:hypothetical protein
MVTGESLPVAKTPGSELIGASINTNGTLRARALRVGSDTALAQIVKLLQEAQNVNSLGALARCSCIRVRSSVLGCNLTAATGSNGPDLNLARRVRRGAATSHCPP